MPLVVHIGFHKTGSTAIQSFMTNNRENLASRGVHFPKGISSWLGHPEIPWMCGKFADAWQDRRYEQAEVVDYYLPILERSTAHDAWVILSSEEFCRLEFTYAGMARLASLISGFNPIIIGYGRDPVAFLLSRYRHEVQMGAETRSLSEFLANFANLFSAAFDFRMSVWEDVFPGRCIFRMYETALLEHGSIVGSFCNLLDLDIDWRNAKPEDQEFKLHPVLLDAARAIRLSNAPLREQEVVFDQLNTLSSNLPPMPIDVLSREVSIGPELNAILQSLRYVGADLTRTVESLVVNSAPEARGSSNGG